MGNGDTIVLESCEYCDSFLNFYPTIAVVLNVEADHLDYFKDLADIQKSFHKFAGMATDGVVANGDDPHTVKALEGIPYVSFGLGEGNRVTAAGIRKIPGEAVSKGVEAFHGAGRRMEFKGTYHGAQVYDDYAHHPDELRATLEAIRSMGDHRLVLAFQPHTYTRTKLLMDDFIRELKKADVVVLAEIYAARESNTIGISSADLAAQIPGSIYCETLQDVTETLRKIVKEGDIVVTMGAGDIFRAGEALLAE